MRLTFVMVLLVVVKESANKLCRLYWQSSAIPSSDIAILLLLDHLSAGTTKAEFPLLACSDGRNKAASLTTDYPNTIKERKKH